jgi:hypothetical protein
MSENGKRAIATGEFARMLDLDPITRLTQRGRDPQTAVYALEFSDGQVVRIGTIKVLWSQTEVHKVLAVALGKVPYSVEQRVWRKGIRAMVNFGCDIIETPGESFEDTVRDWVATYAQGASTDRNGAAGAGMPFIEEGKLHVQAQNFAKYVRRELLEQVKLSELYQALRDIGFERCNVNYVREGRKMSLHRTTASYYRAPLGALDMRVGEQ